MLRSLALVLALSSCSPGLVVTLASDRPTAQANGTDAVSLVATVKDASGKARQGTTVKFSAPSPGVLSASTAVTDTRGEATVRLSAQAAGTVVAQATIDDAPSATTSITFTAGNRLRFATSPSSTAVGNLLRPIPVVVIEDANGGATTSNATVTVAITAGSCAASLDASSLSSFAASNGSVSFPGLKSSTAATGCSLTATSPGASPATSAVFDFL